MARFKMVNGVRIQFTPEEETQRDADEAQALINEQAEKDAEAVSVAKKASGKQKLKDLGLDDEEIKELTGA
tara:strand:+ start:163 stop:375 length:213 start_codon:yes stop_codon:yes gene_type:complete